MSQYVTSSWEYTAQDSNELTFEAGTTFELLKKHNDDWWEGRIGQTIGLFPAAYVKIAEPPKPPPESTQTLQNDDESDDEGPLKPKEDDDSEEESPVKESKPTYSDQIDALINETFSPNVGQADATEDRSIKITDTSLPEKTDKLSETAEDNAEAPIVSNSEEKAETSATEAKTGPKLVTKKTVPLPASAATTTTSNQTPSQLPTSPEPVKKTMKFRSNDELMNRMSIAKPVEEVKQKPKIEIQSDVSSARAAVAAMLSGGSSAPTEPKAKLEIKSEGISNARAAVASIFGAPPGLNLNKETAPHTPTTSSSSPEINNSENMTSAKEALAAKFGAKSVPTPTITANQPESPATTSDTLHPDWRPSTTSDGQVYYYNFITQETSWTPVFTKPRPVDSPISPPVLPSRPEGAKPARPLSFAPKESLPEPPKKPTAPRPEITLRSSQIYSDKEEEMNQQTPPSDWETVSLPDGKVYYFNIHTRETSWTLPTAGGEGRITSIPPKPKSAPPGSEVPNTGNLTRTPSKHHLDEILTPRSSEDFGRERVDSTASIISGSSERIPNAEQLMGCKRGPLLKKNVSKKSTNRNWQNVFGAIYKGNLIIYKENPVSKKKKEKDSNPIGAISLSNSSARPVEYKKREFVFHLITKDSEYLIQAIDKDDLNQWIVALQEESRKATVSGTDSTRTSTSIDRSGTIEDPKSKSLKREKSKATLVANEEEKVKTKNRLTTFFSSRPSPEVLEKSGILVQDKLIFGGKLQSQWDANGGNVPKIVIDCIKVVEEKGMESTGIYRLSGNTAEIQKLRYMYNQDEKINLFDERWNDINVITGALKLYFRELKEPMMTFQLFDQLIASCKIDDYNTKLLSIKTLLHQLPKANFETLKYLINHLRQVSQLSSINKMETANLAIVFGPTLMRPEKESIDMVLNMGFQNALVEHIIIQCEWMFQPL